MAGGDLDVPSGGWPHPLNPNSDPAGRPRVADENNFPFIEQQQLIYGATYAPGDATNKYWGVGCWDVELQVDCPTSWLELGTGGTYTCSGTFITLSSTCAIITFEQLVMYHRLTSVRQSRSNFHLLFAQNHRQLRDGHLCPKPEPLLRGLDHEGLLCRCQSNGVLRIT